MKIRIKIGGCEIEYEGTEAFLDEKIYELINKVSAIATKIPEEGDDSESSGDEKGEKRLPLAMFLKEKNVGRSQIKRFLATAEWLHKGSQKIIQTSDVTSAIKENQQSRLGNPSDCLNKNVSKGHCEKYENGFRVTEEGRKALG